MRIINVEYYLAFKEMFNPSSYYFNIHGIPSAIVTILTIGLGLFVILKNRKSDKNLYLALFCFAFGEYNFMFCLMQFAKSNALAVLYDKLAFIGIIILPVYLYEIGASFAGRHDKRIERRIRIFNYLLTAFFLLTMIFTDYFISDLYYYWWGRHTQAKLFHHFYMLFFTFVLVYHTLWRLYKSIKKGTNELQKKQNKYFFISVLVLSLNSIEFLTCYGVGVYPFIFNIFGLSFAIMVAYTIVRYRLMEIDTVVHRTLLWLLTLLVVILPIGVVVTLSLGWVASLTLIAKLTLISAILIFFVWYYSKLKPYIDHFFRRKKYDYYQVLGEIGQKIGSELDINNVVSRLFHELKDILYIRNGLILVQPAGQPDYIEAGSIGYDKLLDQEKKQSVTLKFKSLLSQWLVSHQSVLEKEQVNADPQYVSIKEEALSFMNQNAIEVLIPVIMENKVNALVGIGKKENLQAYTITDIELLENMGRQIGITIDNALHHEDIVEKERLAEEMKLGREIQMNLLPRQIPIIAGLVVQGIMQPAKEIGGDYYDFISLPQKDALSVVIGDVSGKGVAAGLLMAMAKTAIHTLSQEEASPKQILFRTNSILNQHIGGQKFMTMLYFRWDALHKLLTYSSAGHEHILIFRSSENRVETIQSGGFMLGMISDIGQFLEDKSISLSPNDKIVLYTDGVTEARNPSEAFFGLPRLIDAVSRHGSEPAQALLDSLKQEVYSFIGTREQYDDITLVVMEAT